MSILLRPLPGVGAEVEGVDLSREPGPGDTELLRSAFAAHGLQPQFQYGFHWKPGSVAFWDNRATWHLARNDYHGHRRLMHRITIEGCALN
jgi:alpha-ketoglutarate-dependent taurine dioxygenase